MRRHVQSLPERDEVRTCLANRLITIDSLRLFRMQEFLRILYILKNSQSSIPSLVGRRDAHN